MKAEADWKPTKFAYENGKLSVGPEVRAGSWAVTRLVAEAYNRHLRSNARGRLVDLGCGTVPLYPAYRDLVSEIVCVDWGGSRHGASHLDVEHDLNRPLPFPEARFDTVVLSDVLEHIARPEALLAEIRRVLAPGGRLLMNVPFLYWLHEQPHDYYRFTEHALRLLIANAGLSLLLLESFGGAPQILADVTSKHLQYVPVLGKSLARAVQRVAFEASRLPLAERALEGSRQRFPLGYFLVAERLDEAPGSASSS
jgi:SAM-dependent methyltransferase